MKDSTSHNVENVWLRLRRWIAGRDYAALKAAADALAEQANVHVHMGHDTVQCDALRAALKAYREATNGEA